MVISLVVLMNVNGLPRMDRELRVSLEIWLLGGDSPEIERIVFKHPLLQTPNVLRRGIRMAAVLFTLMSLRSEGV